MSIVLAGLGAGDNLHCARRTPLVVLSVGWTAAGYIPVSAEGRRYNAEIMWAQQPARMMN